MTAKEIFADLAQIRARAPLIHNITNFVVMNTTANALLALGASPVMAHAREEVEQMSAIASALVINIGTLNPDWVEAMSAAMKTAAERGIPIVFDPVGAGATDYRTRACHALLQDTSATVIRGNASEIMALVDSSIRTKGVDSSATEQDSEQAALALAQHFSCVVVVSGAVDLITDGERILRISQGHPLMTRVTGMGCSATALIGAFCAVNPKPFVGAAHAMAVIGICGQMAAEQAAGPGTLQVRLLDSLYALEQEHLAQWLKD